jgi:hypothetical protein
MCTSCPDLRLRSTTVGVASEYAQYEGYVDSAGQWLASDVESDPELNQDIMALTRLNGTHLCSS